MSDATCENCGKKYTPHHAYRNKTQACDGPNGYCAGVIDGREDLLELILRCRPFIWRAMQGGKSPHEQDKEDAKALWPLVKDLEK